MFNIGDRVRILSGWSYGDIWVGKEAVIVARRAGWDSNPGTVFGRIDKYMYRNNTDAHGFHPKYLELVTPLSPFEESVRAYITSELSQ